MICHTFTMGQPLYEQQLADILRYVTATGGSIVTPSAARAFHVSEARE
jgi:hypothetical protein